MTKMRGQTPVIFLARYGDAESAAQGVVAGLAPGTEGYVPVPRSERELHRAVSAGTAPGGRAVPGSAPSEREPRHGRDHVHCLRSVCAGLSGKSDRGLERTQRENP